MANKFYIGQGHSFPGMTSEDVEIIGTPKFIIRSLRENIFSAFGYVEDGYNIPIKKFTLEEWNNFTQFIQTDAQPIKWRKRVK